MNMSEQIILAERNAKLSEAKSLIERGWCQGAYGRTADDEDIDRDSPEDLAQAVCYCAIGAVACVSRTLEQDREMNSALTRAIRKLGFHYAGNIIIAYNDQAGRTKDEVLVLFDLAKEIPL